MHRAKAFVKKTRGGKVLKVVREHYLRDDLPCGIVGCTLCTPSPDPKLDIHRADSSPLNAVYVVDTNVVLHQMDLLESRLGVFEPLNLVFLQTVIEEVRSNSLPLHTRLLALTKSHPHAVVFSNEHHEATYIEKVDGESPNDRNDRAIRTAALWYAAHVSQQPSASRSQAHVVMLTEDRGNREKALAEGLASVSITDFVHTRAATHPALVELLAAVRNEEQERQRRSEWVYTEHLSAEAAQRGLNSGELRRGTFKVSREYWSEATVKVKGASGVSIFIPDLQASNRAVDGDEVAVELLPQAQWKKPSTRLEPLMDEQDLVALSAAHDAAADSEAPPAPSKAPAASPSSLLPTGRVVHILQRHWRSYCGSLDVSTKTRGHFLFLSVNKRIPKIRIQTNQGDQLMSKRIQVAMDSWPPDSRYPLGHYVSTIGDIGDKDTETTVLLIEHDIPTAPWTNSVLACLPPDTHHIVQADTVGRADYRGLDVFSIDPPGCTDIDDALHLRVLDNGNYEVGVHIADVAHYVKPDSALDVEASHRGTSVYLVDRRIDMLPSMLSTNLCSLKSNIDRLTFSVTWEMTPFADIVHTQFQRAVIRSVASLTYQQAQERIDSRSSDSISLSCQRLNSLAKLLKAKRIAAGALSLASNEVKFLLDTESQRPLDVEMYQLKEANSLVEEFMLLANISVATQITEHFPSFALLRRHPVPPPDHFLPLIQAARCVGLTIKADTSRQLADSLDRAVIPHYPFFNKLIRIIATRCMTQAIYFSSGEVTRKDYYHYGLAASIYTHFTSPIRRYADIVVHRLLAASLAYEGLSSGMENREKMNGIVEVINHRHRMAQLVSRASAELYTLIFFAGGEEQAVGEEEGGVRVVGKVVDEDGVIINVRSTGIRVMIPRYGIEGSIPLHRPRDDGADDSKAHDYVLDEEHMTVSGPRGVFRIFEQVRVRICVKEKKRRRWLSMELMEKEGRVESRAVEAVNAFKGKGAAAMEDEEKRPDDVLIVQDEQDDGSTDPSSVKRRKVLLTT